MSQWIDDQIRKCQARLEELDDERLQVQQVLLALQGKEPKARVEAPYGFKADGTPRKRPAPSRKTLEKAHASLRARMRREPEDLEADPRHDARYHPMGEPRAKGVTRLHVTTSTPLNKDEARAVKSGERKVAGQT